MPTPKTTTLGLDLDELDRDERPEPFTFSAKLDDDKHTWTLTDPVDVPWQIALAVDVFDPRSVLRALIRDDDEWKKFCDLQMPRWKIDRLVKAIDAHYSLGESAALPTS